MLVRLVSSPTATLFPFRTSTTSLLGGLKLTLSLGTEIREKTKILIFFISKQSAIAAIDVNRHRLTTAITLVRWSRSFDLCRDAVRAIAGARCVPRLGPRAV